MAVPPNQNGSSNPSKSSNATSTMPEFSCRGEKITTISNMLKAMHLGRKRESQLSNVQILEEGMQFSTSKAKSLIACCNVRSIFFQQYNLLESVGICVDISTLIQVLTIFGTDCEYHLEYKKTNDFLRVFLSHVDDESITECELFTFNDAVEIPNLRWPEHRIINRLTGNAPFFKDIFSEIDALAKDEEIVWFHVEKGKDGLELENLMLNDGDNDNDMDIDKENEEKKIIDDDGNDKENKNNNNNNKNDKNVATSSITIGVTSDALNFQATIPMCFDVCPSHDFGETHRYQYRLSLLRPALRAIAKSDLIRIHFNEQETLQIQHVFKDAEDHGWVEFTLLSHDTDFIDED